MSYYSLPALPYAYDALEPVMSKEVLTLHHDKHHQSYVDGANVILKTLESARQNGSEVGMKALLKELSFHIGGHVLHSIFWENLAAQGKGAGIEGKLGDVLKKEFGSVEQFKKEFTQAAVSVEGSGWAALTYCQKTQRPLIMQIEKHNLQIYPTFRILLVLDVWEHAYYLDYKNARPKFVENWWTIVNWDDVTKRLTA
ncbi:MAG: superoxide dismutase (Mn/Fe), superoxide dismutase, Fe-Mn family [Candidatus Peregrinibacteria bacterium GW2011_GWE2_39_6]|nr:MAG: superoxide dismutase (Mn/Fe), superoxide dismutase, Fe-Mn family [Candidatus Peregrinibacteria bacterium GW2011_GWF2_39_17]KKR25717.1 MAG: superoxide dismutase (Mn/Fe), superoxide dismutase, Fe-Mn family [Candidatus Peregrinibacteria bacterium GW2011_GWE2_39_6]HCW32896.1 superoxide dismutase [Candidatus Peregrinibacteria bacterium]